MLQLKTIHEETYALLKAMLTYSELQSFSLAGGTALALQLGHRISIDLGFFTLNAFGTTELFDFLRETFSVSNCTQATNSLSLYVKWNDEEIKVDMLRHNYPLLRPIQKTKGIRIFSLEDIAAMKLNAIANRGSKKYFYDIHVLLGRFSLKELLAFFEKNTSKATAILCLKVSSILLMLKWSPNQSVWQLRPGKILNLIYAVSFHVSSSGCIQK